jgi:hypothetical protein
MQNTESTTLGILAVILGVGILCLVVYGLVKLVLWTIEQWNFINSRCLVNHAGFKPLSFFRQFLVLLALASCVGGVFLMIDSGPSPHLSPPLYAELIHGFFVFTAGILLLGLVFFWIRVKTNYGIAVYSVLLMVLVSFLLLLAILLAFLSFSGKNQATVNGNNPSCPRANQEPRAIGTVVQSSPQRVTIYDEKGNMIRTLNGVLESFTPSVVNLRPNYSSNLVQAFDVNGNLKYTRHS